MPMVPEFQGNIPQVRDNGSASVAPVQLAQSSFDYGKVLDQAMKPMSEFANSSQKTLQVWHARTVKAESDDAEQQVVGIINNYMYDPENGYFSKKGRDAMDGYQASVDGMQKDIDKVVGGLQPAVREAISSRLQDRMTSALSKADRWRAEQTHLYTIESSKSREAMLEDDAALHYDEPEYLEKTWGAIELEIDYQLKDEGWPVEKVEQYKKQKRALFDASRYSAWAEKDPIAAFQDFRVHSGDMDPEIKRKLHKQLFVQSQDFLSEYLARHPIEYDEEGNIKGMKWMDDPLAKTGDPLIDSLTPVERLSVVKGAIASVNRVRSAESEEFTTSIKNSYAKILSTGKDDNPMTQDEFVRIYGPKKGAKQFAEYEAQCELNANIYNMKDMTISEMGELAEKYKPVRDGNVNYAQEYKRYESLLKARNEITKQRKEDPIEFAIQNKRFGFEGLNFNNASQLQEQLVLRSSKIAELSRQYGTQETVFTKAEMSQLTTILDSVEDKDQLSTIGILNQSLGKDGVRALLNQLKNGNQKYALSIGTMNEFADSGVSVGQMNLVGANAIKNKVVKIDEKAERGIEAQIYQKIGADFGAGVAPLYTTEGANKNTVDLVKNVYAYMKLSGNDDLDSAIETAVGKIVVWNNKKIVLPRGIESRDWFREDFGDRLEDIGKKIEADGATYYIPGKGMLDAKQVAGAMLNFQLQTLERADDGEGVVYLVFDDVGNPVIDKKKKRQLEIEIRRTSRNDPYNIESDY